MVCSETVKTELEAGTWTNYGSTPKIFTEDDEVGPLENYIRLGDDSEEIERSSDGVRIHAIETCSLKLFASDTDNRDNMVSDIEAIFVASSEALLLRNGTPSARRGRYIREFNVELTTKS